jgi:hypothetical protein
VLQGSEPRDACPRHQSALTPSSQRCKPLPHRLSPERSQSADVGRHTAIGEMTSSHAAQSCPLLWDATMPASHQVGFQLLELRTHPFSQRPILSRARC